MRARQLASVLAAVLLGVQCVAQEWRQLLPQQRRGQYLAFDEFRGNTVLFGGEGLANYGLADTWTFDGRWHQVSTPSAPPGRSELGIAFDTARRRIVIYGGQDLGSTLYSDTWEFDGSTWTQVATAAVPHARFGHRMVYDVARGRVVLFGGRDTYTYFAETWEYDGTNWTQVVTATSPPANLGGVLAYDRARSRTVLFNGSTWEYDGTSWSPVTTSVSPASGTGLVYDTVRQRVVLPGATGIWEYDGTNWSVVNTVATPSGAYGMAYDPVRARIVAFGGAGLDHTTWEYDGTIWSQPSATLSPGPRAGHAVAYDSWRRKVVMFGGVSDPDCLYGWIANLAETWEYDNSWVRVTTPVSPLARWGAALAFDAARGRTVLFGGAARTSAQPPNFVWYADTWEYDGSIWTQVITATAPPPGTGHRLAYDPVRARTVYFGGTAQTWEYDGANWTRVMTPVSPPARSNPGFVYDPSRLRIVLQGGSQFTDMWEYDGSDWHQVNANLMFTGWGSDLACDSLRGRLINVFGTPISSPQTYIWEYGSTGWVQVITPAYPYARQYFAMTFDQARGRALLFGGWFCDPSSSVYQHTFSDTWEYVTGRTPTFSPYGGGCPGSAGVPFLAAATGSVPALGTTFRMQIAPLPPLPGAVVVAFGFDLAQWQSAPLPLELSSFGLPGCRLWLAPTGASLFVAHGGGVANVALPIAANPGMSGLVIATQALVLDPSAPAGAAVSNAGVLRLF